MPSKLNELFDLTNVDSVILRTDGERIDPNFYYSTQISKASQLSSFLVLRKNKKPIVITNMLEYGAIKNNKNISVLCFTSKKEISDIFRKNLAGRKIGINFSFSTLKELNMLKKLVPKKKFVDVSGAFSKLREVKTKEEIKKFSTACKIAEETLEKVGHIAKIGMSEKSLADQLEYMAKKSGAEDVSFPTIVATGKNASVPHHITDKTRISDGFLLVDFGVVFEGYCSDLTRTFFVGYADEKSKYVYSVVYRAQRQVIKNIQSGARSDELFRTANNIIEKELGQKLIHSVGHGLGIDVHDFPLHMGEKSKFILKENMCLTVEPGYYKNIGIRIEDDVIVKKNGCKLLSNAPKELVEI